MPSPQRAEGGNGPSRGPRIASSGDRGARGEPAGSAEVAAGTNGVSSGARGKPAGSADGGSGDDASRTVEGN